MAAVVLCGGRSSRLGRDKSLLRRSPEDPPLVLLLAERLSRVADPVLLAPGTPGRLGATMYREVADALPGAGPLGGLVAALQSSPRQLLAAVAVDMPFASPGLLAWLGTVCGDHDAAVPLVEGAPEPLHAVYARSALPVLAVELQAGRRGLRRALDRLRVRLAEPDEWPPADVGADFARNLNLPAEVAAWMRGR